MAVAHTVTIKLEIPEEYKDDESVRVFLDRIGALCEQLKRQVPGIRYSERNTRKVEILLDYNQKRWTVCCPLHNGLVRNSCEGCFQYNGFGLSSEKEMKEENQPPVYVLCAF